MWEEPESTRETRGAVVNLKPPRCLGANALTWGEAWDGGCFSIEIGHLGFCDVMIVLYLSR